MRPLISVASKELTGSLNYLESTLTKNTGVGGVLWLTRNPIRISVLSDRRESKDLSSPVSLLARSFHSLHKECFTTLLQSSASALFLKTAGCVPTIPILACPEDARRVHAERLLRRELSARTNRR